MQAVRCLARRCPSRHRWQPSLLPVIPVVGATANWLPPGVAPTGSGLVIELPGLSFQLGLATQLQIWRSFGLSVTYPRGSPHFFFWSFLLVVVFFGFARSLLAWFCKLRSVALLLILRFWLWVTGCSGSRFPPMLWVILSTSSAPLIVRNTSYLFTFGTRPVQTGRENGGSSYLKKKNSWQPAHHSVKNLNPLTGANAIPVRSSVFRRLDFPRFMGHKQPSFWTSAFKRIQFPSNPEQPRPNARTSSSTIGSSSVHQHAVKWGPSLNLNFREKSKALLEYLPSFANTGICSRYLSNSHERRNCRAPIKCHACLRWGHV